jgi:hypothetical protein
MSADILYEGDGTSDHLTDIYIGLVFNNYGS